ncbi:NAD(P)-binding protein [Aureobasidium subglaciale]|nr:NAD(P)-binding protein [Aureobasidium subglaciale]
MPVYVLTGANRGLGLEFVRQLSANSNNKIIAAVRSLSNDLTDLKALNDSNKNIHISECDTGDVNSITSFVQACANLLLDDGQKIDFLLNNSGINDVPEQTSLSIGEADLARHISINVLGPAKTVQAFHASSLLSPNVRILNMTSGLGSMEKSATMTPRKCTTYSISKAALNMLTVHQGEELREKGLPGAVVICMDPGWVKTRMGGEDALIEAEESIGGMLRVLHGLSKEDTASFWTYSGEKVPCFIAMCWEGKEVYNLKDLT